MEDWKKYVFDPKNPTNFKAYKLLKKILKDGNTLLVTDMYYFNELFKKEIWTQDVIDELWDKPDNFEELSSNEKAEIYEKNYSRYDYLDLLNSKVSDLRQSKYYKIFPKQLKEVKSTLEKYSEKPTEYLLVEGRTLDAHSIDNFTYIIRYGSFNTKYAGREVPMKSSSNCCFLIKEKEYYTEAEKEKYNSYLSNTLPKKLLNKLQLKRTSIFFIKETIVEENGFPKIKNLHPVIYKEENDIFQLLDFIIKDIKSEIKPKVSHLPKTYINSVEIKNYFSIKSISLDNLKDKKEIYLMGENGDGKTILLQAILLSLRGNQNIGTVSDFIKQNPLKRMFLKGVTSDKQEYKYSFYAKQQKKSFNAIIGYGIERFRNDSGKIDETGYLSLFDKEVYLRNPSEWLQHLDYKESKGDTSEISLSLAKEILTDILERDVTIIVTPDKVTFTEKGTVLNFNQLSDGYQSVIIWVCDLISRLAVLQPNAASTHDYSGVVIVDEIGAYLHPKWAYGIVKKLREWFPNLQFIFTTHNPIVILGASADAVFYKVYKENGKTKVSEPVEDISDLMLNSLVTSPLFNLPTARPHGFDDSNDISDDDYIYRRIHQLVQQKLQTMPDLVDDDVIKMIEAELEKV